VTLGPPQQGGVPNAHDNSDFLEVIGLEFWRREGGQKGPQIWKKCEDDHLKTKGGASQGKRFHLVTLGPPRQGEGQTHIIKLFFFQQ
jgi:hypothetical protein